MEMTAFVSDNFNILNVSPNFRALSPKDANITLHGEKIPIILRINKSESSFLHVSRGIIEMELVFTERGLVALIYDSFGCFLASRISYLN